MITNDYVEPAPGILVFENVVDNPQRFIDIASNIDDWQVPKIGTDDGPTVDLNSRSCSILRLNPSFKNPIEWFELAKIIWTYGNEYSRNFYIPFANMELLQMIKYNPNTDFYKPHADDGPDFPRCISSILYLNDVSKGGETHFDKFNVSVSPKAGRLLMFPSNFVYTHEGRPPINETKHVVVTWFNPLITGFNDE